MREKKISAQQGKCEKKKIKCAAGEVRKKKKIRAQQGKRKAG